VPLLSLRVGPRVCDARRATGPHPLPLAMQHLLSANALIAGTIFVLSKLPLRTWFRAIYHLTQTKQGISSIELSRRLGVMLPSPPSQSRTCGFPASGSSRERFARGGVAMENPDWRQCVPGQHFVQAGPRGHALTVAVRHPLAPNAHHLVGEPTQAPTVAANAIVGEVAPHHRGQVAMLVADRPVAVFPAPVRDRGLRHRPGP